MQSARLERSCMAGEMEDVCGERGVYGVRVLMREPRLYGEKASGI